MLSTDTNTERDIIDTGTIKTTENINIEVSKNIELTSEISKQLDMSTETIEIPDKIITETTYLPEILNNLIYQTETIEIPDKIIPDKTEILKTELGQISEITSPENVIYR